MTNFPLIIILTVVSTNWISFPEDHNHEDGTNKIHQYQLITTNIHVERVSFCTNRLATALVGEGTNGVKRWIDALPPLPNHPTKE